MTTDPRKARPGEPQRPGGAEDKTGPRAKDGGKRTSAGSTYGDFVPAAGQPHRNDDRDMREPGLGDRSGGGDLQHVPRQPGSQPMAGDAEQEGVLQTGSAGEAAVRDPREASHESNVNKSQDTTHVHSSTTSRKL
jgi:hypothetical protein